MLPNTDFTYAITEIETFNNDGAALPQ